MPIVQVPYGNALPTEQNDYVRQNNLISTGFMDVNQAHWEDGAGNIAQGAVFQVGGTVYYCNAATAIGGVASNYIKLTPAGASPNMTLTPSYVANLGGVSWDSAYNGYYDVGGNAYMFDEFAAVLAGQITGCNCRLWQAFVKFLQQNMTFSGNPDFQKSFVHGRVPTGILHQDGSVTQNNVFDALDPYIPNTNDEIILHGAGGDGSQQNPGGISDIGPVNYYVFSKAIRTNSTTITLYVHRINWSFDSGTVDSDEMEATTITCTNGSASVVVSNGISISW